MIELRDYQKDLLSRVQSELQPDKARVMMQLPTGGGKTVIAAHLLKDWLVNGRKAVWLTHRNELAFQTRKMLYETAGIRTWLSKQWTPGKAAQSLEEGVVILMAQTVSRRSVAPYVWGRYDQSDLMIIDEAHHATADGYTRAMERWPGRIIGMTATPWRLSRKEGFDHLFTELTCGPQMSSLQEIDFLCNARVLIPSPKERIQGGKIGSIGDYTEAGIEQANQEHIMTAGILGFWKAYARDRQTIIYAVSVRHAENIVTVFRDANIRTGIMLGSTHPAVRENTIAQFAKGEVSVLVNVAVATEGFDLPDASCVVIARPTQSLALYLQMLGRGLRPKPDGGDCLILDVAANSILHGLPEEHREWSLAPRGQDPEGEAPAVWCEHCGAVSPAASHNCQSCGAPLGEDCQRCGKWRSWNRWSLKDACRYAHDIVCDRCHRDAHIQNRLPVTTQMEILADLNDEDSSDSKEVIQTEDVEMTINDSELNGRLALLLSELLEEELHRATSAIEARRSDLHEFIKTRELALSDESVLDELFEEHLNTLPERQKPNSNPQKYRMFNMWENGVRTELKDKKSELANWVDQPIDKNLIFERCKSRMLTILYHFGLKSA